MTIELGGVKATGTPSRKPDTLSENIHTSVTDIACAVCTCDRDASVPFAKNPS